MHLQPHAPPAAYRIPATCLKILPVYYKSLQTMAVLFDLDIEIGGVCRMLELQ